MICHAETEQDLPDKARAQGEVQEEEAEEKDKAETRATGPEPVRPGTASALHAGTKPLISRELPVTA